MFLSNTQRESSYCPQCGKHYLQHDDFACGFRYYQEDGSDGERGWIPDLGVSKQDVHDYK